MRRLFTKPLMFSVFAVAVALALPHAFKSPYYIHLMTLALIWIVLAQGQNLTQGFIGYVSIAQAGFMGIGAYISTLLTMNFGFSVWATLVIAPLLTGVMAIVAGYPSLRVKGHYFSIVTLAYNMVIFIVLMISGLRSIFARMRLDQMINICWKYFAPLSLLQVLINLFLKRML